VLPPYTSASPDVAIIHANAPTAAGNVQNWGITGRPKGGRPGVGPIARDGRGDRPTSCRRSTGAIVLPTWAVTLVALAHPADRSRPYSHGFSFRTTDYYVCVGTRIAGTVNAFRASGSTSEVFDATGTDDRKPTRRLGGGCVTATPSFTADEMMTVAASRAMRDGRPCFLPDRHTEPAANLARRTHRTGLVLLY